MSVKRLKSSLRWRTVSFFPQKRHRIAVKKVNLNFQFKIRCRHIGFTLTWIPSRNNPSFISKISSISAMVSLYDNGKLQRNRQSIRCIPRASIDVVTTTSQSNSRILAIFT